MNLYQLSYFENYINSHYGMLFAVFIPIIVELVVNSLGKVTVMLLKICYIAISINLFFLFEWPH